MRKNVPAKLGLEAKSEPDEERNEAGEWRVGRCQKFVMTAPGPKGETGPRNVQRE